ncbi:hypothetical protein [uncultured Psychroserpens sp.]|uniref:hypothetical protein n=1 Tax=uncultured Psychroserpens sp. TaxID=255436 RepID=UPI00262B6550|nr:hypothetical protein [uncultured Psychroserpens sp.]
MKPLIYIVLAIMTLNCVQQTHEKTITVMVNMNGAKKFSEVGIRGTYPLSWNKTTFLSDTNNDGIYEGAFNINTASHDIEFKFVTNNNEFELENQSNRSIAFEYRPETIVYEAVFNDKNGKQTSVK